MAVETEFFLYFLSMDTNGVITISSKDWSRHPVVEKTENIPEIILYWKHSTVSSSVCTTKIEHGLPGFYKECISSLIRPNRDVISGRCSLEVNPAGIEGSEVAVIPFLQPRHDNSRRPFDNSS